MSFQYDVIVCHNTPLDVVKHCSQYDKTQFLVFGGQDVNCDAIQRLSNTRYFPISEFYLVLGRHQGEISSVIYFPVGGFENTEHEFMRKPVIRVKRYYQLIDYATQNSIPQFYFDKDRILPFPKFDTLTMHYNAHEGKRGFILGNGPSLANFPVYALKNEITFGANRVYLGFKDWGFAVTYHACLDRIQFEEHLQEWLENVPEECTKLWAFDYFGYFAPKKSLPLNFNYAFSAAPRFAGGPEEVFMGHSSVYLLLQVAYAMGCNPIYLVGVDTNYEISTEEQRRGFWTSNESQFHFHKDYCDQGDRKFALPNLELAFQSYAYARQFLDRRGVKVINLNPDSKVRDFEFQDYREILSQ
jgi:hypothetical protein